MEVTVTIPSRRMTVDIDPSDPAATQVARAQSRRHVVAAERALAKAAYNLAKAQAWDGVAGDDPTELTGDTPQLTA